MKWQKPRGTRDLWGQEIVIYNNIIKTCQQCVTKYGYQELQTPMFESTALFLRAVGATTDIVSKEIYQFNDKGNRDLALRPEGTAPIVRAVIENKWYQNEQMLKYFYYGPMFRYERPQKGRQRQFNQFGVEVIGDKHPLLDVEIMMMALEMMTMLTLTNLTLNVNYFGSQATKERYQSAVKAQLLQKQEQLCSLCQTRIASSPLRILDCKVCSKLPLQIPSLAQFLTPAEMAYFASIKEILTANKVPFAINNNLVRGLDYYTGIVFEITSSDERIGASQNTVVGGGRYDNLFQDLGAPLKQDACGFALGIERLMLLLADVPLLQQHAQVQLQIISENMEMATFSFKLLQQLRHDNFIVAGDYKSYQSKNKKQLINRFNNVNILFLSSQKTTLYIAKNKTMMTLTFSNSEELIRQLQPYLVKE